MEGTFSESRTYKLTFELDVVEARTLMGMMQNPLGTGENTVEKQIREFIFVTLQRAGVKPM